MFSLACRDAKRKPKLKAVVIELCSTIYLQHERWFMYGFIVYIELSPGGGTDLLQTPALLFLNNMTKRMK